MANEAVKQCNHAVPEQLQAILLATALGAAAGATAGAAAAFNTDFNNRALHENESKKLEELKKGKTPQEQKEIDEAVCYRIRCAAGISKNDPNYAKAQSMQEAGAKHTHWQQQLQATGLFVYDEKWDAIRDFMTSNEMVISKTAGGYNLVVGGLKAGSKASLSTVSCGTVAGCLAAVVLMATIPNDLKQSMSGSQQLFADYEYKEGQRVLDSFNPATHWGDQDPLKTVPSAILNAALDMAELSAVGFPQAVLENLRGSKTIGQAIEALRKTPSALKQATEWLGSKFKSVSGGVKTPVNPSAAGSNVQGATTPVKPTTAGSSASANPLMEPEANFAGRGTVRNDLSKHLTEPSILGKSISGGHDLKNFESALQNSGGVVLSKVETSLESGIYVVKYRTSGSAKEYVKTVYDSMKYPNMESDAILAANKALIRS